MTSPMKRERERNTGLGGNPHSWSNLLQPPSDWSSALLDSVVSPSSNLPFVMEEADWENTIAFIVRSHGAFPEGNWRAGEAGTRLRRSRWWGEGGCGELTGSGRDGKGEIVGGLKMQCGQEPFFSQNRGVLLHMDKKKSSRGQMKDKG